VCHPSGRPPTCFTLSKSRNEATGFAPSLVAAAAAASRAGARREIILQRIGILNHFSLENPSPPSNTRHRSQKKQKKTLDKLSGAVTLTRPEARQNARYGPPDRPCSASRTQPRLPERLNASSRVCGRFSGPKNGVV